MTNETARALSAEQLFAPGAEAYLFGDGPDLEAEHKVLGQVHGIPEEKVSAFWAGLRADKAARQRAKEVDARGVEIAAKLEPRPRAVVEPPTIRRREKEFAPVVLLKPKVEAKAGPLDGIVAKVKAQREVKITVLTEEQKRGML